MPHALTWPGGGDITPSHAKPPEGGYYTNWDPYAVELEVTPVESVNPVQTQHVLIATVRDKDGKPLPNRRVEWIISEGSVGDIVEVDESGWRNSRGYKVDNHYAVSHTNNFDHVLDLGDNDPSNDISLEKGQTWCVITSPIEGDTHITVYAPGIYDWSKHKVFVTKHWYDVQWEFPPAATNPIGTPHELVTNVMKYSDKSPLEGYVVTYEILDGPSGTFSSSGSNVATVYTDGAGQARVTLNQTTPMEGTNNIKIDIMRPANEACCKPPVHIATGYTTKTWIGPDITCDKSAPASALVGEQFSYTISVSNPSQVAATNVSVTDTLPAGVEYVSSSPNASGGGNSLSWNFGSIEAGATQTISINVRATTEGTYENCASVTADHGLSAQCCASTAISAPALVVEKQCTPEVVLCEEIQYTVIVRNTGTGPATNVQVVDELPDGLTTTDGQSRRVYNAGTLAPGEAKQATYSARASRTGTFTNRVVATGDGGLSAEDTCQTVVTQPVLTVSKSGPATRYIGRPADYEITVQNTGDAPARDTVLTDTVPAGLQFVSASDGGNFGNGVVTWNLGTLQPNESRTVTVQLRPTQATTARNTASAKAFCAEAQDSTEMEVKGVPAILLEVVDVEDPIEVGSNITYIITVTNQGTAVGTNIVVNAELPPEMEYVSSDGTQASIDGRKIAFAPLPSLAPKAKHTYRVVAKGNAVGDLRFRVSMTSDQTTSSVDETESTRVY
ncbi:MAG: DUF11 domain-containing protein [Planctomycetota bacterium]|nr:MAG: DUF11 domain-containing protein [Planctomycetota bacterium]